MSKSDVLALTVCQQKALETLLVGGTDQQAADAGQVSRSTLLRWKRDPTFSQAFDEARSDLLRRTASRLHATTSLAVKALEDVVKDDRHPAPRVAAARAILDFSQRALELQEFEKRLAELEEKVSLQQELRR